MRFYPPVVVEGPTSLLPMAMPVVAIRYAANVIEWNDFTISCLASRLQRLQVSFLTFARNPKFTTLNLAWVLFLFGKRKR